jgi:lipoate-protein ligase A
MAQFLTLTIEDALSAEAEMLARIKSGATTAEAMFWQASTRCLVAPRAMEPALMPATAASLAKGWPCIFRSTGGDVVPQGPGVWNYSVGFRRPKGAEAFIDQTYRDVCAPLVATLARFGVLADMGDVPGSYCNGNHNVVLDGLKLAGTAQRIAPIKGAPEEWAVLGHAMIIVDAAVTQDLAAVNTLYDLAGLARWVQPETATSLDKLGLDRDALRRALIEETLRHFSAHTAPIT